MRILKLNYCDQEIRFCKNELVAPANTWSCGFMLLCPGTLCSFCPSTWQNYMPFKRLCTSPAGLNLTHAAKYFLLCISCHADFCFCSLPYPLAFNCWHVCVPYPTASELWGEKKGSRESSVSKDCVFFLFKSWILQRQVVIGSLLNE